MHLLRPAHKRGAAQRREGRPRDPRGRGGHRLPGRLSDPGNLIRQSQSGRLQRQCAAQGASSLRTAGRAQHTSAHDVSRPRHQPQSGTRGIFMMLRRSPPSETASRWIAPDARRFETVNALVSAPLLHPRQWTWRTWWAALLLAAALTLAMLVSIAWLFWKGVGVWDVNTEV